MIKAYQLTFNPLEDPNTPNFECLICQKVGGKDFLYASIKFAADADFTVIVCSRECEKSFKDHKGADHFLKAQVRKVKKMHLREALKKMG